MKYFEIRVIYVEGAVTIFKTSDGGAINCKSLINCEWR